MVRVSSSLCMTAALAGVFAAASTQQASAANFKCYGINYNIRAGPDWAPDATKCKNADQIAKELTKLKTITDTIRLYSLTDCNQGTTVVPAAIKAGLKVSLGLWVGPEASTFAAEKAKFQEILAQDGLINSKDIVGIHVGSEAVYRGDVNTTVAISNFNEIKKLCTEKGLDIPVTIADIGDIYMQYPELIEAVDVVSANAFPFWEKIDADKAVDYFYQRYQPLEAAAKAKGKEVLIGETGWASAGVHSGASVATPENAALYFHGFYNLAKEHNLKYYYFAGFDEEWKIATSQANATVEAYFGIFKADGDMKSEYASLTFDGSSSLDSDVEVAASSSSSSAAGAGSITESATANSSGETTSADGADDNSSIATTDGTDSTTTDATANGTDVDTNDDSTTTADAAAAYPTGGDSTETDASTTSNEDASQTSPSSGSTGKKRKDCEA
uniref:glucan endo-1,3-beta-D-glucosidase n=1 Tax=Globisporangium ultimum (strain ATCC 200006 / CBS 805.95 / DAOM BR144) TaxID=431595 RepID=K3WMY5_GLOUD